MTERKSDLVRRLVAEGEYKSALRIASGFHLGIAPEDRAIMKRGYECYLYPDFYTQIMIDVPKSIEKAVQTVKRLYGPPTHTEV